MNEDGIVQLEGSADDAEAVLLRRMADILLKPVLPPYGRLEMIPASAHQKFIEAMELARKWERVHPNVVATAEQAVSVGS